MSDPFEESPWGDQVSLSNHNSSGASSLHNQDVAAGDGGRTAAFGADESEGLGLKTDGENAGKQDEEEGEEGEQHNSRVNELSSGNEHGIGSSSSGATTSAMAAAGLLDDGAEDDHQPLSSSKSKFASSSSTPSAVSDIRTPERHHGKTRVTPRRLATRSRKITQPVFTEEASNDPLGPLGPLGPSNGDDSESTSSNNGGSKGGAPDSGAGSRIGRTGNSGDLDDSNDTDGASMISSRLASTSLSPTKDRSVAGGFAGAGAGISGGQQGESDIGAGSGPGSASLFQDVPLNYPSSETDNSSSHAVVGGAVNAGSGSSGASPEFQITVGDPIKVGDITSAHTVYTVHCKTTSPNFSKSETAVTRRYRDFRWVFHALEHNNPGVIIPPPPDKQAVGRFNEDFVEQRRAALENMLKKMAAHPILKNDPDLRLFLESEAFSNDIKNRVMSSDEVDAATSIATSTGGGFMGTLGGAFSFSAKFVETSQWFIDKKEYLDSLESQLKSLAKALDLVVSQRRELSDSTGEFALVLEALADVEISKSLSQLLVAFSESQTRIQDLYSRQCLQDILSLSTTIDEYLRLISSVRTVFLQRQKAYFAVQSAEQELGKKQTHLEKLLRQGKTLQDKISALEQEVDAQEKKVLNQRVAFDDMSKRIVVEFDRLEHERIHDFRNSVELFLENAVESQKEAIEVWETFYQRSFVATASS
ncbi:Vps5p [Sugiyamaella lignohabitans]|uniref:Vps5p n=1 Tax=Sugiyamaella lignohabitans TaxID=796027 RepID=A0A167CBU5_9ASCO|nr:Vps5p [Sugiyamaella lignohabitans]ANB11479.1 Vps5p [Sugiyamaella lignohabitans]